MLTYLYTGNISGVPIHPKSKKSVSNLENGEEEAAPVLFPITYATFWQNHTLIFPIYKRMRQFYVWNAL